MLLAVVGSLTSSSWGTVTYLADDFNDGNLATNPGTGGGFVELGNGAAVSGSVSESGSQARIVDGTGDNTYGIYSSNAFDLSDAGLSYSTTWQVGNWTSGTTGAPRRIFLTLQTNDNWIFGGDPEESRIVAIIDEGNNNATFRYQNRSGGSNTNFDSSIFDLGTFAQDSDGFTATLLVDSVGFNLTTAGLDATNQVIMSDTWANIGTDFTTVMGTDGPMHVTGFIQDGGTTGSSLDFEQISLTSIPEPSGLLLLGLSCGLGSLVRRRQ